MIEPTLDSWTTIFLLAGAQGLFLFAVFVLKKRTAPNMLLATATLLFSITLIEYVGFWSNYRFVWPHLNNVSLAFPLLFGPLIYGYIQLVTKRRTLVWKDVLHLIPFLIIFSLLVPYFLIDGETKIAYMVGDLRSNPDSVISTLFRNSGLISIAHLLVYLAMSIMSVARFESGNESMKKWLNKLCIFFGGFTLGPIAYTIMLATTGYVLIYDYYISFAMSAFIYLIGYIGYAQPSILDYKTAAEIEEAKYKNSGLSEEKSVQLKEALESLVSSEQVYLNRDLKLDDLAEMLNVSKHHISQVLNNELQSTFSQFINAYRVEAAKKILAKGKNGLNMHGIAIESGFNNKTTFNLAFKRHTGITPSQYRSKQAQ